MTTKAGHPTSPSITRPFADKTWQDLTHADQIGPDLTRSDRLKTKFSANSAKSAQFAQNFHPTLSVPAQTPLGWRLAQRKGTDM